MRRQATRFPSGTTGHSAQMIALAVLMVLCAAGLAVAAPETSLPDPSQEQDQAESAPQWIRDLPPRVLTFLASLQYQPKQPEEPWGLFTFSQDSPVTYSIYATSAAWGLAEACGGIENLPGYPPDARERMAVFIQHLQDPATGRFADPHLEAHRTRQEGLDIFRAGVTKYALGLLSTCGAKPLYPYSSGGDAGAFDTARYLETIKTGDWDMPWAIGSHAGFQTVELFRLVNQDHPEHLPVLIQGIEFILGKQNPQTGMWGCEDLPIEQQLGGALKIIGRFQFSMGLIVPHMNPLADCLILHHRDRTFYPIESSATSPRNVAELAYACAEASDYRRDELLQVLRETAEELRQYRQPDGGFGQRRRGTDPISWNDAQAAPSSPSPRGDIHGTQSCIYAARMISGWLRWSDSPWPHPEHWRTNLIKRRLKYTFEIDETGKLITKTREP